MSERADCLSPPIEFPITEDPFFQTLAETSADCIRLLNLDGEVQFMNRRGQAMLEIENWSRNEGRYWPTLLPPVSFEASHAAVQAALRGEVARFRCYCPTAKGKPKWWDNVISPVRAPASQELIGLLATSRDITAELATETFLEVVIDNAPLVVLVKDAAHGRFQLINRLAEQVFGLGRQQMLGKTDCDFFPPEQADYFRQKDREAIDQGSVVYIGEEPVETDSGLRYFRTRKVATYGPDGPQHIVCVAEDITEERRAREDLRLALHEAEAASRAKSEFLANMSHEIRTPLNGVVGVADLLAGTALSDRQREMIELVRASGRSLERLLSDILDLARVEARELDLRREAFHLGDLARLVAGLHQPQACARGVRLDLVVDPAAEATVLGDADRVKQVLTNLLSNAVKFTAAGHVGLRVEADGPAFRFTVNDSGVGFDPALKDQLFRRFQQADGSITRRFGGSGLGLAITRELVALMGGEIDCESRAGEGSMFWVRLPLPAAPVPPTDASEVAPPLPEGPPLRLLLADDHPTNRKVVELILEQVDVEVVAVEDGRQAVDAFAAGRFDLVLMDMQMPVMDGLTATRLIRELEVRDGWPRTPVAMLTANAMPEHVHASLEAGADRHIAKPVSPAALIEAMSELLQAAAC